MTAFLEKLVEKGPPSLDEAVLARFYAIKAVAKVLEAQQIDDAVQWIHTFRLSELYREGGVAGRTRISFSVDGTVMLLKGAAATQYHQRPEGELVELLEGVPEAKVGLVDGRSVPIQRVLGSLLCAAGATRFQGKAPRSNAVYRIVQARGR